MLIFYLIYKQQPTLAKNMYMQPSLHMFSWRTNGFHQSNVILLLLRL